MVLASLPWLADRPRFEDLIARPAWHAKALCAQPAYKDVNFFVGPGQSTALPKSVCARCVARSDCLAWAIEHKPQGVFGGTSERERRHLGKTVSKGGGDE